MKKSLLQTSFPAIAMTRSIRGSDASTRHGIYRQNRIVKQH
ncbi:hypothetical protein [Mucilaginibacter phenanthrenivorans]|nr:hypothetical protein [Mucilaginibacter phenanthrenivorans]